MDDQLIAATVACAETSWAKEVIELTTKAWIKLVTEYGDEWDSKALRLVQGSTHDQVKISLIAEILIFSQKPEIIEDATKLIPSIQNEIARQNVANIAEEMNDIHAGREGVMGK